MQFISPLSWVGGKSKNIKKLLPYFPKEINNYVEAFCGGASIGLRLLWENRIKGKVIFNDINTDLINFWKGVQKDKVVKYYPKKIRESEQIAKDIFNSIPKEGKTPAEFLFINRLSFSGIERAGFSKTRWKWKYFDCLNRVKICEKLIKNAEFYNQDYKEIVTKYDGKDTLFYFDPPYHNVSKNLYKHEKMDFLELRKVIDNIEGKFILSLNDNEFTRELFKGYIIIADEWRWNMTNGTRKKGCILGKELVITNIKIEKTEQMQLQL